MDGARGDGVWCVGCAFHGMSEGGSRKKLSKSLAEYARHAWLGVARAVCVARFLLHLHTGDVKSRNPYEFGLPPSCNVMILLAVCSPPSHKVLEEWKPRYLAARQAYRERRRKLELLNMAVLPMEPGMKV